MCLAAQSSLCCWQARGPAWPLWGIVHDALQQGHSGPIHLFHGALHPGGLYLREELEALASAWPNFSYSPTVLNGPGDGGITVGAIDSVISAACPKLAGWRGFVCGDPGLVRSLKRKLFLVSIAMGDIYSDAFLPSA